MIRTLLKPLSFLPALLLMYMIFSFSGQPGEVSSQMSYKVSYKMVEAADYIFDAGLEEWQISEWADKIHFITRKLAHMTEYFALAIAVSFPLYVYGMHGITLMLVAGLFCLAFACGDEYHQSFVLGRSPSKKDVAIDSVGIFFGIILVRIVGWSGRMTIFKPKKEKVRKPKKRRKLFGRRRRRKDNYRGDDYYDDTYYDDDYPREPYRRPPYRQDRYPEPPYPRDRFDEPPYPQDRYNEPPYPQDRYNEPLYPQDRYDEPPYPQDRYSEPPYPRDRYNEPPYPQDRFGEPPYPQDRYDEPPYPQDRYSEPPYPQGRFNEPPYPQDRYDEPPVGQLPVDWEDPSRADDWGDPSDTSQSPQERDTVKPTRKKPVKKEKDWFFDM